jgi:hypothetical protein
VHREKAGLRPDVIVRESGRSSIPEPWRAAAFFLDQVKCQFLLRPLHFTAAPR